jgi:threonine/homoserine/homoserine lactone efflux protein
VAGFVIAPALQPYSQALRVAGGLVLVLIASAGLWRMSSLPSVQSRSAEGHRLTRTYLQFVAITIVNPLTIVYFTALIIGRSPAGGPGLLLANLLFVAGAGVASLSWQTLLAVLGSLAGKRISPRFRVAATVVGNLIVLGLGMRLILTAVL